MMPAWNAGRAPGTALSGPSLSIPMTAAVARTTSSTVGSPRLPEKNHRPAVVDRLTLNDRGVSVSFRQYIWKKLNYPFSSPLLTLPLQLFRFEESP
jgi:hypothetical protein